MVTAHRPLTKTLDLKVMINLKLQYIMIHDTYIGLFHNTHNHITTDSFMLSSHEQSSGKVAKMHLMDITNMNINNYRGLKGNYKD